MQRRATAAGNALQQHFPTVLMPSTSDYDICCILLVDQPLNTVKLRLQTNYVVSGYGRAG